MGGGDGWRWVEVGGGGWWVEMGDMLGKACIMIS